MAGGSFQLPKSAPSEIRTPVTGHLAFFWGDGTEGTSEGLFYSMDDARTVVEIGGETLTTEQVIDAVAAALVPAVPSATIDVTYDDTEGEVLLEVKDASITTDMLAFDPATQTELGAHITDTTDAHAASAIGVTPFGTIAADDVQAALEEIVAEFSAGTPDASAVVFTPAGGLSSTNVQDAIEEVNALVGGGGYTDELAQDAVGTILTDTATVNLTYTDATPAITADVIDDSITFAKVQNIATARFLGRATASSGDVEELTVAQAQGMLAVEQVTAIANAGSTETIPDVTTATAHRYTLDANCTFTFPTAAAGKSFFLELRQDATGSRTVTWPGTVKWPAATAPTLTTTASKSDVFSFICLDGTNWLGAVAGQNYS